MVVNYLPVGSEEATKWYVEQVLNAGCAMVNCMPVFIAREAYWQRRFEEAGVPIIGDDIKSQVGATISHRVLTTLFRDRGVHLDRTMQLNVGGNSDFLNMLERDRLESKKISKTNAVTSMLDYDIGDDNVHVGPSDYVPWLTDRKWAYIRMEGKAFGDVPAEPGAEARGLGLAELGRHRDRRRPPRQAGAEQRRRRRARGAELVPDEVAARADPRRRGAREHRALHHAAHAQDDRRSPARLGPRRGSTLQGQTLGVCPLRGPRLVSRTMRVCLVTPFAWSQPHEVNEHVAGVAQELRQLGHTVTVLAPSSRAGDLRAGRRALRRRRRRRGDRASGRAVPISRRSSMGVPVGVRANLRSRSRAAASTSSTASSPGCRASRTSRCATRTRSRSRASSRPTGSATRPARRSASGCSAGSTRWSPRRPETAAAAAERFPGDYRVLSPGVDTDPLPRPGRSGS